MAVLILSPTVPICFVLLGV